MLGLCPINSHVTRSGQNPDKLGSMLFIRALASPHNRHTSNAQVNLLFNLLDTSFRDRA
jgi:hypothetical protein